MLVGKDSRPCDIPGHGEQGNQCSTTQRVGDDATNDDELDEFLSSPGALKVPPAIVESDR